MRYICPICGYVYDEAVEGTPFAALPDTWTCPLCGAGKSTFAPEPPREATPDPRHARAAADPAADVFRWEDKRSEAPSDLTELPAGVVAAICSNLARGCEKQYLAEEAALFGELAAYFTARADATEPLPAPDGGASADDDALSALAAHLQRDLNEGYPALHRAAIAAGDRGTQRICVWGEKVTRALASLAERYRREGPAMLEGTRIWVCSVCGFTFVGERPPALCPVCKVPDWKFDEIRGRA